MDPSGNLGVVTEKAKAPGSNSGGQSQTFACCADEVLMAERIFGKDEARSSILRIGSSSPRSSESGPGLYLGYGWFDSTTRLQDRRVVCARGECEEAGQHDNPALRV